MIVPGGGISLDGTRWIGCRPNYLLPVKVLSRLFHRLMLEMLLAEHHAGRLQFFGGTECLLFAIAGMSAGPPDSYLALFPPLLFLLPLVSHPTSSARHPHGGDAALTAIVRMISLKREGASSFSMCPYPSNK
jgi:hypothetical protein